MIFRPCVEGPLVALAIVVMMGVACLPAARYDDELVDLTPRFEVVEDWPALPDGHRLGDVTSFAVDEGDNVWLLHRPRTLDAHEQRDAAPPILVLDRDGNLLDEWGGDGPGFDWPQREHFIHVDGAGGVWIGGNYCPERDLPGLEPVHDDQILKFRNTGDFALQIGRVSASTGNDDPKNLHWPADAAVHVQTNELFVADGYGNHRVIVFDASSGAFKRMWGAFGGVPRGVGVCPAGGALSTALGMLRTLVGLGDASPSDQFDVPHSIRVSHDGIVYVADRENRRVQTFTTSGEFLREVVREGVPFARNLTLSRDEGQRHLYVGSGGTISVFDRKSLELVGEIRLPGMLGYGFDHHIAADSQGSLYIAGSFAGMAKLARK